MLIKPKTFSEYFGENNLAKLRQSLERLFSSPGGCVIILLPPYQNDVRPKIIDAYYNIHANCLRGAVDASLKDAVQNNLLIDGLVEKYCVTNHRHNKYDKRTKQGEKPCPTGAKIR